MIRKRTALHIAFALITSALSQGAAAQQCTDRVDNDADGKVDTLIELNPANGETISIGTGGNGSAVKAAFNQAIITRGLNIPRATTMFLRSTGGSGGGFRWNDNGAPHLPTLQAYCQVIGYKNYVSSTCLDEERSGIHPFGKCNFHSPGNNTLIRYSGAAFTIIPADPKYGNTYLSSIVCRDRLAQCSDLADNDGDGLADLADPGCASPNDDDERPHDDGCTGPTDPSEGGSQCQDGLDNDGDGLIDLADPGCSNPNDDNEGDGTSQCQDGIDNDSDGAIDFPTDFSCSSRTDNDETNPRAQCQDGVDNDSDGLTDLADPGCTSRQDNDETGGFPECSDSRDNDSDGATDFPTDVSCSSPGDTDEANPKSACQDGLDNDGDGLIDLADPGCSNNQDNNEGDGTSQCQDGADNDSDGATDFPADFSCSARTDTDETNPRSQCQDGVDNDSDGKVDRADPGCSNAQDNNEGDEPKAQCQDGIDNDQDGATDFPADFSCASPTDSDESNPKSQCQDGVDNDSDGLTDLADPGCNNKQDNNEGDDLKQCQDGRDNDADGATDFPADYSCSSPTDSDESNPKSQCQDGIDNDSDGLTDLADPGCSNNQDNKEGDDLKQCQDGRDNDADGATDFPADYSCSSPTDSDESDPKSQCQDGIDNDSDGLTDLADPGCSNKQDNNEGDDLKQCQDGIDNDHDGATDFPADYSCSSPTDSDESDPESQCQDGLDNDSDGLIDQADPGCSGNQDNTEAEPASSLEPFVDCVANNGDGTYTAWFGYQNSGAAGVTIAAGANSPTTGVNAMTPAPADQGQVSTFQAGTVNGAFGVVFDGSRLTWTLQVPGTASKAVTAKKDVSRQCAPLKPVVECIDRNAGGKYVAHFGYKNENSFELKVPVGPQNRFVPAPEDRGQPDQFFTGTVTNLFAVEFDGSALKWNLGGTSVTADKHTPLCTPNSAPVCNAGGPYAKECQGSQTILGLSATGSNDPEGQPLTYQWTTDCAGATLSDAAAVSPTLTLTAPADGAETQCKVLLTVSDGIDSALCEQPVAVGSCQTDCEGTAGGSAQADQCGVCGGDGTTCLDCNGVPNGGAVADQCGVCGGSNACLDCLGIPNGTAKPDNCGVCAGDGSTCLGCTDTDITSMLFAMDTDAQRQEANIVQFVKRLQRLDSSESTSRFIAQKRVEADKLATLNWQLTWSLPQIIKNCTDTQTCAQVDNSLTVNSYNTNAKTMRDISNEVFIRINKFLKGKVRLNDKKLDIGAQRIYEQATGVSSTVPRFNSVCQ